MSTQRTVIANVSGRLWSALMNFAFVPFYIYFMGPEAYGLVGFFTSMLATFFVLDMGLSTTLNREMARLSAEEDGIVAARTLMRTLETIYWVVGVVLGLLVVIAASTISQRWLNAARLPARDVTHAVQLMGLSLMLRWPAFLYQGALMGMRRHVAMNLVTSVIATLQGGGAVLVLWLLSRSPLAFFGWQVAVSALQIVLLASLTWRGLAARGPAPRFEKAALRPILGFSAGITGITLLSVVLTQLDKLLLAKLLPLEQFGYYALAGAIAAVLTTAAGAIYGAVFPSIAHLTAAKQTAALSRLYHKSAQLMSVAVIPAGLTLALFAPELLTIYTGNMTLVHSTALLLSLLTIGNIFLSLMMVPLALQLAAGWTQLSLYKNVVAVIAFVPLLFVMVGRFGAPGAAMVWIMLTFGYVLIEVQVMHRRLLPGEQWRWYWLDVGAPLAASSLAIGIARLLVTPDLPRTVILLIVALAGLIALGLAALSVPAGRQVATAAMARLKGRRIMPV